MVALSMAFFEENLKVKRLILLSLRSIAVSVRLFKRTLHSNSEDCLASRPRTIAQCPPATGSAQAGRRTSPEERPLRSPGSNERPQPRSHGKTLQRPHRAAHP